MSVDILAECDGNILTLTLNRPADGNRMSDANAKELTDLLLGAPARARIVVLRAAGADFCLGRTQSIKGSDARPEALAMRRARDAIFNCYGAFRETPLPVIAVVQGRALGFGCALAAVADITIAAESATFQMPEFGQNIMPTMAMSALLGRVSQKDLMYITYSTATFDAARAQALGLVNEIAPDNAFNDAVNKLCKILVAAPLPAILAVKEYARIAPTVDVRTAIEYARNLHATINSSSEMKS